MKKNQTFIIVSDQYGLDEFDIQFGLHKMN